MAGALRVVRWVGGGDGVRGLAGVRGMLLRSWYVPAGRPEARGLWCRLTRRVRCGLRLRANTNTHRVSLSLSLFLSAAQRCSTAEVRAALQRHDVPWGHASDAHDRPVGGGLTAPRQVRPPRRVAARRSATPYHAGARAQ